MPPTTPEPLPRVADVRLRGGVGRAYWPADRGRSPPALVVYLHTAAARGVPRRLCAEAGVVVLAIRVGSTGNAVRAVRWVADHAAELDADPGRVLVAGVAAGEVIRQVRDVHELAGTDAEELAAELANKFPRFLGGGVEKPDPGPT